jgi:hypothetical protein
MVTLYNTANNNSIKLLANLQYVDQRTLSSSDWGPEFLILTSES